MSTSRLFLHWVSSPLELSFTRDQRTNIYSAPLWEYVDLSRRAGGLTKPTTYEASIFSYGYAKAEQWNEYLQFEFLSHHISVNAHTIEIHWKAMKRSDAYDTSIETTLIFAFHRTNNDAVRDFDTLAGELFSQSCMVFGNASTWSEPLLVDVHAFCRAIQRNADQIKIAHDDNLPNSIIRCILEVPSMYWENHIPLATSDRLPTLPETAAANYGWSQIFTGIQSVSSGVAYDVLVQQRLYPERAASLQQDYQEEWRKHRGKDTEFLDDYYQSKFVASITRISGNTARNADTKPQPRNVYQDLAFYTTVGMFLTLFFVMVMVIVCLYMLTTESRSSVISTLQHVCSFCASWYFFAFASILVFVLQMVLLLLAQKKGKRAKQAVFHRPLLIGFICTLTVICFCQLLIWMKP